MKSQESAKEPITLGVLFRYKFWILTVACLVIFGGYMSIITQPRQFVATSRLAARFSSEALNLQEIGHTAGLRFPLLEEEVKAYAVQIMDPSFVDLVLQELPAPQPVQEPAAEPEELGPAELIRDQLLGAFSQVRKAINSFIDSALLVKDTIVSDRERKVLEVLSSLEVASGSDASHIITISCTNKNPEWAATVANGVALKFIDQQKKKTRKRDIPKLEAEVGRAKQALVQVRQRLFALSDKLENVTLEDAIKGHYTRLEELKRDRALAKSALTLLSKKILPLYHNLPLAGGTTKEDVARVWQDKLISLWENGIRHTEDPVNEEIREKIEALIASEEAKQIENSREVLKNYLQSLDDEIDRLSNDRRLGEAAPEYSVLLVEQTAAQTRLTQAETELLDATRFNVQLDDENVSENVALWQRAKVPPFPIQQRRLLKLMVVVVLGLMAGFAAAIGRHMAWPKIPAGAAGSGGHELDVPIIILPDQGGESLESDLEFDVKFPDDQQKKGA
jgi:uncharacterized protein involved in exopolysaccharide biosynthesis